MLSLNQKLQESKQKFLRRLLSNLNITKLSKHLESFWELSFTDFLKELKKQKIELSLKQQDEWEEYFNEYQKDILNIQKQIHITDDEINHMVYQLYGLTDEEIKMIE